MLKTSPPARKRGKVADNDLVHIHAPGRSMTSVSKRRVIVALVAVVSAVVTSGFSLGFVLHGLANG